MREREREKIKLNRLQPGVSPCGLLLFLLLLLLPLAFLLLLLFGGKRRLLLGERAARRIAVLCRASRGERGRVVSAAVAAGRRRGAAAQPSADLGPKAAENAGLK